ncbi:glucosyltransferase domain-containing protein [Enterococcus sp. HY326]|uniref:glucosyltransferase domain-containing protein n=1 Tax=Enterococcus sp. HY326 TaxID=2971265 RepID=UPI00223EF6E3|nr:glucosyltransferase domain-containing protein [Enterococcus sp. HY326]
MLTGFKDFGDFVKKNIGLTVFTFVLTFVLYGIKITNYAYGMDSINYINNYEGYLDHWYGIGRFGEVFLKKYLWGSYTNIYLLNILAFILFALSSLLICYLFSKIIDSQKFKYHFFIIPALFLTSSIFVVQFYFILQNFEFALGIFFVVLSILLIQVSSNKLSLKVISYVVSAILLFLAIAIYQTFILFFAGIVAGILLLECYKSYKEKLEYTFINMLFQVLPFVLILIISTGSYFVANNLVLSYLGIESKNHSMGMMVWPTLGFKQGMVSLLKAMRDIVFLPNDSTRYLMYNYGVLISTILLIPVAIMFILKKGKNILVAFISIMTIYVMGFGIILATGTLPTPRSMAPQFPFLIAFLFFFISLFIEKKQFKVLFAMVIIFMGCSQFKTSSNLLFSEEMTFQEDQRKVLEVNQAINNLQLENTSSYKLVIIGTSSPQNIFTIPVYNELIGVSMFQFAWSDDLGSYYINDNIISILNIMGNKYETPTLDEYLDIWQNRTSLNDSSPNLATEVIDNYIVVKVK